MPQPSSTRRKPIAPKDRAWQMPRFHRRSIRNVAAARDNVAREPAKVIRLATQVLTSSIGRSDGRWFNSAPAPCRQTRSPSQPKALPRSPSSTAQCSPVQNARESLAKLTSRHRGCLSPTLMPVEPFAFRLSALDSVQRGYSPMAAPPEPGAQLEWFPQLESGSRLTVRCAVRVTGSISARVFTAHDTAWITSPAREAAHITVTISGSSIIPVNAVVRHIVVLCGSIPGEQFAKGRYLVARSGRRRLDRTASECKSVRRFSQTPQRCPWTAPISQQ